MSRLPSLRNLEAFIRAAETLNFHEAANLLHVTPSAISRRIQSLEQEIGRALFHRSAKTLRLTEHGGAYYERVAPAFVALRAVAAVSEETVPAANALRVTAYPPYCHSWLTAILNLPGFTETGLSTRVLALDEPGGANPDVSVFTAARGIGTDEIIKLFDMQIGPVCRPELLVSGLRQHPERLQDMVLIGIMHARESWSSWFSLAGVTPGRAANIVWADSQPQAIDEAVKGRGVALCEVHMVDYLIAQNILTAPFDIRQEFPASIYVRVYPSARDKAAALRFVEWIRQCYG